MMTKRILQLSLLIIIGLLVVASPVYAISVANAVYVADIVAYNAGTATNYVATVVPINTQALIDGKFVTSDLLNTAIQTPGGSDVPYMPGVGTNPWVFWVPNIGASEQKSNMFYAGGPAMQTGFYYFPNTGGMTTPDTMVGAIADDGGVQTDDTTAANNDTANDMTLLPAVPAVNDAYYFGGGRTYSQLTVNIGTQGVGTWTITWEYWNGAWVALSGVTDNTNGFTATTGNKTVTFTTPTDWATTTVKTISAYWIRARVSAYTSKTTIPKGTQSFTGLDMLELGNNFTIEQKGWVGTSAGSNKNLVYKQNAFRTYVSASGNVTSAIYPETAYPTVAGVNGGITASGTSHIVNLPSNIKSGNLLLVLFSSISTTTTFPEGWTQLFSKQYAAATVLCAWYRIADGTEGATITVTTGTSVASHNSYLITDYLGVPESEAGATGSSVNPDPPSLTPSWGARNTLWLAVCGYGNNSAITNYPTSYTDGFNYKTSYSVGSARRELNVASENPAVLTIATSIGWVANTIAVLGGYGSAVAAVSGVSSGELIVKTTADGTNMTLTVTNYAGTHQGNSPQSVALSGVSVPNNSNNWSFITNGSMPYMEYHKIWCPSTTLTQHIVYERNTTFQDLTEYNNDATPTFITTSSDPDVTATFQNFRPIKEAICTVGLTEETPEMLTTPPEMPTEFYTEGSVNHLPGAELVNNLLDAGGIPYALFWIPFCFGLAALSTVISYYFLKSMFFIAIIGGVIILFFGLTGAIPLWTFLIYAVIAGGVLVSERTFGW